MGTAISHTEKLCENDLLKQWTGLKPLTDNDPFWNQLLSFNFKPPTNSVDARFLDETVSDICEALMYNSPTTGNFAAFVRVFLRRAHELKASEQCENKIFLWQTSNALIIMRYCCKFFAERMTEHDFLQLFNKHVLHKDGNIEVTQENEKPFESLAEELLNSIIEIIVDLPVNDLTRTTHIEALNLTIALLSGQLFVDKPLQTSRWIYFLTSGKCSIHACLLTKTLLLNYMHHSGSDSRSGHTGQGSFDGGGSFVLGFAASMLQALKWGFDDSTGETQAPPTVSSQSLLFLLILISQHSMVPQPDTTTASAAGSEFSPTNSLEVLPYKQALMAFTNSQEKTSLTAPTLAVATFKLDYSQLYDALSHHGSEESTLLLLYFLLHQNLSFRNYVLSRINIDALIVPVLKVLYSDSVNVASAGHHLYLTLVVILILSEDDFFCKIVHETVIRDVDWITGLSEITLGGLIIVVLIKTVQLNLIKVRDRYLHTNCLAALANMSATFKNLTPFVAQKLIGLLELLSKRYTRVLDHVRISEAYDLTNEIAPNPNMADDVSVLEEGIRMLLEILNSCLTNGLSQNPHLIYTLLYKRDLFNSLQHHVCFQDILQNIDTVLNHFAARVKTVEDSGSVSDILDIIRKGVLQWYPTKLKKFPELKFKYIEDDNTDEFFVPYTWTLVYTGCSGIFYWDPVRVRLFNAGHLIPVIPASTQHPAASPDSDPPKNQLHVPKTITDEQTTQVNSCTTEGTTTPA